MYVIDIPSSPFSPLVPLSPLSPLSPLAPLSPFSPLSPLLPFTPCIPAHPFGPIRPFFPSLPFLIDLTIGFNFLINSADIYCSNCLKGNTEHHSEGLSEGSESELVINLTALNKE